MENKVLTPSESLALIASVITEAKTRFQENGFAFIFIGLCCAVASLGQFILLSLGRYEINYFPYFIMPFAGVMTYFYDKRKAKVDRQRTVIGTFLSVLGIIIGFNATVAGFFFWSRFGMALFPFMLILFSVWSILSGVLVKQKVFVVSGILINLAAFGTFFVKQEYHPLVLSIVSLVGIVVPGMILYFSHKKSNV